MKTGPLANRARTILGTIALLVAPVGLVVADAQPGYAEERVVRLAGADRVETAIAISQSEYTTTGAANAVVLVNSLIPADSLVGGPLAYRTNSPILVNPPQALDARVEEEISRLLHRDAVVYIIGGPFAISNAIETRLQTIGFRTTRFAGRDRFETSVFVARGMQSANNLFVANGQAFTDALIAGSAAAHTHSAVLLSNGSTLTPQVREYRDEQSAKPRYAIGAPAAQADPGATAITGSDQYDTAFKVAQQFFGAVPVVGIASGVNFPDAMAGVPHAKRAGGPILLTDPNQLSDRTRVYLTNHANNIDLAFIYGGPAAVKSSVDPDVQSAMQSH